MKAEISRRLALRADGWVFPFAIIDKTNGKAVGMIPYMNSDAAHERLEIGATWFRQSVQKTPINTECKLLSLRHVFEELCCNWMEFKTHFMNFQNHGIRFSSSVIWYSRLFVCQKMHQYLLPLLERLVHLSFSRLLALIVALAYYMALRHIGF